MRSNRPAVATLALGPLLALAGATPAGAAPGSTRVDSTVTATAVKVLTCAGKAVVRPRSYVLACADANTYFEGLRWTTWGSRTATATGTFVMNDCAPTCVSGKFHHYPATVTLSAPRTTKLGVLFGAAHYRYTVAAATTLPLTTLSGS